ncbi:SAVED domain-containing protein [Streptomyces sp. NPDC015242]|uniref:SAVED domain-containing protein n=1 Tax=Streptomyces sp. NPDC015242 TaxID=3364951 RepID=UPI0036FE1AFA
MRDLPAPSSTGVRIAGDRYQWLAAWQGCVAAVRDAALRASNPVVAVGVEVDDAGNLDDVVLYRQVPPHTYMQVKYAADSSTPVNGDYLLKLSDRGGPSILRKMAQAWEKLTEGGTPVDLALLSNRSPDAEDPLISLRDSRTQLLVPKAAQQGPGSKKGEARRRWADGAGLSEDRLLDLLKVLRFDLARDVMHLHEHLQMLMFAAGLRFSEEAMHSGADWVARQVADGQRRLSLADIREAIRALGLETGSSRPVLSIATLKPDPMAEDADYALDWVDRFEGASPYVKRRPLAPATWAQLQADIEAAPYRMPPGTTTVAVTGSLRLAPAFVVGAAFRMVAGSDLAVAQREQLWSSTAAYDSPLTPAVDEHTLDLGTDLAVAVAVATDPTQDVLDFLREHRVPVSRLLVLRPPGGAKDNSIPDAATASALAVGIRDLLRRACRAHPAIHLFQAGPMGLALLLGNRWNRLRPTTVYEDVNAQQVYEKAFVIDA